MENIEKKYDGSILKPVAYLKDLYGVKFVVEISKDDKKSYALVFPPLYEILNEGDESLLISAVAGHYFTPFDEEIFSYEDSKSKLISLNKKIETNKS